MSKGGFMFDWQEREGHPGRWIVAIMVVGVIFMVVWGVVAVRIKQVGGGRLQTAGVIYFRDDADGIFWRNKAKEEGPFPGRFVDGEPIKGFDFWEAIDSGQGAGKDSHEVSLVDFQEEPGKRMEGIFPLGEQFFPRVGDGMSPVAAQEKGEPAPVRLRPVLTAFDGKALAWMPDGLPEWKSPAAGEGVVFGAARFMISLREDGSVGYSITLDGVDEPGVKETEDWLSGVEFQPGKGERWLGLTVEFFNQ